MLDSGAVFRGAQDGDAKIEELLRVHGHVVLGEAGNEACQWNRLVQHECVVGQEERGHCDGGGILVELVGDVAQDRGLIPDTIDQVRPA